MAVEADASRAIEFDREVVGRVAQALAAAIACAAVLAAGIATWRLEVSGTALFSSERPSLVAALAVAPLAVAGSTLVLARRSTAGGLALGGAIVLALTRLGQAWVAAASDPFPQGTAAQGWVGALANVGWTLGLALAALALTACIGGRRVLERRVNAMVGAGVVVGAAGWLLSPGSVDPDVILVGAPVSPWAIADFADGARLLVVAGGLLSGAGVGLAALRAAACVAAGRGPRAQRQHLVGLLGVGALGAMSVAWPHGPATAVLPAVILGLSIAAVVAGWSIGTPDPAPMLARWSNVLRTRAGTTRDLEQTLRAGFLLARAAALGWAMVLAAPRRAELGAPTLVWALLWAAVAAGALGSVARKRSGVGRALLGAEAALALGMVVADSTAFGPAHPFSPESSLGGPWPWVVLAAVASAAGPVIGAGFGAALGLARLLGLLLADVPLYDDRMTAVVAGLLVTTAVGGLAGAAAARLRTAEVIVAEARAREQMARRLHDGVLQALAVVQRRAGDPELVAVAAGADAELRGYLASGPDLPASELETAVRATVDQTCARTGLVVEVVVDEVPPAAPSMVEAVAGAVGEALANVAKHAGVDRATVWVGREHGAGLVTIVDDGKGLSERFSPGMGVARSIVGRMHDAGGRAEVAGLAGGGAEVRLWLA